MFGDKDEIDSSTWFKNKIRDCVGEVESSAVISDYHSTIEVVVRTIFANAHHGSCCHHLKMNVNVKYRKVKSMTSLYLKTAKAYCMSNFQTVMATIHA